MLFRSVLLPRHSCLSARQHLPFRSSNLTAVRRTFVSNTAVTMSESKGPTIKECRVPLDIPAMYKTDPPPHHSSSDPAKRIFRSPWPSAGEGGLSLFSFLRIRLFEWEGVPLPPPKDRPKPQTCTWKGVSDATESGDEKVVFTWIGHAGCHFRIPMPSTNGTATASSPKYVSVLTDPVLSYRCSPSQLIGPARLQDPPTSVQAMATSDVEGVWPDLLVLSHNHYDHLDHDTVKQLISRPNGRPVPHIFCTLGVKSFFLALGVPESGITELDWWQQRQVEWKGEDRGVRLTCVPAQHFSGRSLTDRNRSVWAGWVIEAGAEEGAKGKKVYFAGDSAFRAASRAHIKSGQPDDALPYCPAFEEIGSLFGPIDLAAIPIGAYKPRMAMSPVHMDPIEAVKVHQHVRAKQSIGIHWGSFALAAEPVYEPQELLKSELAKQSLDPQEFITLGIGETRSF